MIRMTGNPKALNPNTPETESGERWSPRMAGFGV